MPQACGAAHQEREVNMDTPSAKKDKKTRCPWVPEKDELYIRYHDEEWGHEQHDDHMLYEMLILESFQAGLSWITILRKRENFRKAYDGFDVKKTAAYGEEKEAELMSDPGIIRNRAKIRASICNSRVFLAIQQEFGSFDRYLYSFTDGKVIRESCGIRTTSLLSDAISKDLKKRGMRFVGSTTIYSYLQAVGVISGHTRECFLGGADGTAPAVSSGRTPVQG